MGMYNFYAEEIVYYNKNYRSVRYPLFISVDSIEEAIEIVKNDMKSHLLESDIGYIFNSPYNAYQPSKFYYKYFTESSHCCQASSAMIILTEMFNPIDFGIASQYVVYIYSDIDIINRYEIYSTGQDSKILKRKRREFSDRTNEAGILFDVGDVVRIKYDPSDIIYTVLCKPNKNDLENWENVYKVAPINSKVDNRKSFNAIIHESELEKVEEE